MNSEVTEDVCVKMVDTRDFRARSHLTGYKGKNKIENSKKSKNSKTSLK